MSATKRAVARSSSSSGRPLRGLFIDNDLTFAFDTSRLLEDRLGYRNIAITMEQSESPEDAIRTIRTAGKSFDLVITDMRFPPVGRPDAPPTEHAQRGRDVMLAAIAAKVPVVLGFTAQGSELFREWRTRCREIGVQLYQLHDLISAEEDSVTDDIAKMLRDSANLEAVRTTVAVCCDTDRPDAEILLSRLTELGLTALAFDAVTRWGHEASLPSEEWLGELFSQVQAVLVLFSPQLTAQSQSAGGQARPRAKNMHVQPEPRILVAAGMALALNRSRTILLRSAELRSGLTLYQACPKIDGSEESKAELARLLEVAGCRLQQP